MSNIFKVAEKAGVSKSTVSRVINHAPGVAEPLRKAVLDAMEDLNYRPSSRRPGRKPKSRQGIRTGNVLMMYAAGASGGDIYQWPVLPALIHSIEGALSEVGMSLVVARFDGEKPLPPALDGDRIDGALLLGDIKSMAEVVRGRLAKIPTVLLMRNARDISGAFDRVLYDNQAVGPIAAEHLLEAEVKSAVFLNHDPNHPAFEMRQRSFAETMKRSGSRVLELTGDAAKKDPQQVANTFARKIKIAKPEVTGACTSSDLILPYLYVALRAEGIEPQVDLKIISCDNEDRILSTLHPRPATIDIRADYIGRLAVRQLKWRLAHPQERGAVTISVEPELVLPAS